MMLPAALSHVNTWIFDLDQTLYPADAEVMSLVEGRMSVFVARETGLPYAEAYALQKRYLNEHGTTLAGLMAHHNVDPHRFLNEVHDVSIDKLAPDPELNGLIADLPGRKGGVTMPAPVPQPRYALWGTAFGSTGNTDADGNAASLSRRSGGARARVTQAECVAVRWTRLRRGSS